MPPLDVQPNQSGPESLAVRLRYEAGRFAGCMAPAVAHQRASGMGITGTAPARRRRLNFESSLNRFANKRRFRGQSGHRLHCEMSAYDTKRTSDGPLTSLDSSGTMACRKPVRGGNETA
jgi:hypothetical protein